MEKSEQINELAAALVLAQGGFPAVLRGGKNPHLKNTYATLDDVIEAIRAPLCTQSLSFLQLIDQGDDSTTLTTVLLHKSGQFISATANVTRMAGNRAINDMQSLGAALTYMKRYQLSAMLGLNTEADNDGNGKQKQRNQAPQPKVDVSEASVKWALDVTTPSGKKMSEAGQDNLKYVLSKPDDFTPEQVKAAGILMHAKAKSILVRLRAKNDVVKDGTPAYQVAMDDINAAMLATGPSGDPLGKFDRLVWGKVASAKGDKYAPELKKYAGLLMSNQDMVVEWRNEHGEKLDAIAAQDSVVDDEPPPEAY